MYATQGTKTTRLVRLPASALPQLLTVGRTLGAVGPSHVVASTFSDAFWPNLWSALIASLVTGLLVGLAVWQVQRRAEARQLSRAAERELAGLKAQLRPVLAEQDVITVGEASASMPPAASSALALLDSSPIEYWIDILPSERSTLHEIVRLQREARSFRAVANDLDVRLAELIRMRNGSQGLAADYDHWFHAFFVGMINQLRPAYIVNAIDAADAQLPQLQATYEALSNDPQIHVLVPKYAEARQKVSKAASALGTTITPHSAFG